MTNPVKVDALIILIHGIGRNGRDMLKLAERWRDALPTAIFAAPDAPFPFDGGLGRQWFSSVGLTDQNRSHRIAAARPDFDGVISGEIEKHGFTDRLDRVALVGFSQGSMMLIDAVVTGRWPVASAVAFAGRLTADPVAEPKHRTRLLLLHGAADSVVPPAELGRATAVLRASGFAIEGRLFPDIGHTIAPEPAQTALEFIRHSLSAKMPAQSSATPPSL